MEIEPWSLDLKNLVRKQLNFNTNVIIYQYNILEVTVPQQIPKMQGKNGEYGLTSSLVSLVVLALLLWKLTTYIVISILESLYLAELER